MGQRLSTSGSSRITRDSSPDLTALPPPRLSRPHHRVDHRHVAQRILQRHRRGVLPRTARAKASPCRVYWSHGANFSNSIPVPVTSRPSSTMIRDRSLGMALKGISSSIRPWSEELHASGAAPPACRRRNGRAGGEIENRRGQAIGAHLGVAPTRAATRTGSSPNTIRETLIG